MKLDDYKSTMGSVKLDADAKRRILASCKNGVESVKKNAPDADVVEE